MATPSSISLRAATPQDAAAVAALGRAVFSTTFGHTVTPEQLRAFLQESYSDEATLEDITNPQKDMILAVEEGGASDNTDGTAAPEKVVGFVLLTRGSTEPCVEHVDDRVELQRIYIAPGCQGRGVGGRLIGAVEDLARRQGFRNMWLGVWEENHKAARVYARHGYRVVGKHDFDVGGDIQRDNVMLKQL